MKKHLFIILALLLCALAKAQDIPSYYCNFSEGMPPDFKLYDLDGAAPLDEMTELGFEEGKAWIVSTFSAIAGCASSTSYNYKVNGEYVQANKWMVTPGVKIEDVNAILSWKCDNVGGEDGLDVLISTTGNTPEDFTEAPVYSSESEVGSWVTHTVKLDKYNGKTIYVAFVNKNYRQYIICVDDIFLGTPSKFSFGLQKQEFFVDTTAISAKGTLTAGLDYTVTGYTVNCLSNGETYSKTYEDLLIAPSKKHNFEVTGIPIKKGEVLDYVVTINIEGEIHDATEQSTNLAFLPNRKIVGEEATATWAGFAPRGFVGMKMMKDTYPDDFIGISVHCSAEESDPMQDEIYASGVKPLVNMNDLPSGIINRKYNGDPYTSFENYYNRAKKDITVAIVGLTANMGKSDREIIAHVSTQFAIDYDQANYKIALVLIEDSVTGYQQVNDYGDCYYANGIMGGYEDLPAIVPGEDMSHQAVARTILGSFSGLDNSIPKQVRKDNPVLFEYSFEIPATVSDFKNLQLVAMLIDNHTGEIKNADKISLATITDISTESKVGTPGVKVYQSASQEWQIRMTTNKNMPFSTSLYDLSGQKKWESNQEVVNGEKLLNIPSNGLKGVYLLKIVMGEDIHTTKIIF